MRSVRMTLLSLMLIFASQPIFSQTDQANEIRCSTGTACKTSFIPKFSSNGGSATVNNSIIRQSGQNIVVSGNVGIGTSAPPNVWTWETMAMPSSRPILETTRLKEMWVMA